MAEHGGYRQPENPAPTSPPGALSQRTDGGATQAPQIAAGNGYGERAEMLGLQGGAAMQGGGGDPVAGGMPLQAQAAGLPGLTDPTARPDEHVTAGNGSVPGVTPSQIDDATRERLINALPTLAWLASQPKASEQTRQFFRQVRGDL